MLDDGIKDYDHLTVTSFDPTKVQFQINDIIKWRKENSDAELQIGSFVKIKDGNERSIIVQIQSYQVIENAVLGGANQGNKSDSIVVTARPVGVLVNVEGENKFQSGIKNISIPPQGVTAMSAGELSAMLSYKDSGNAFSFGRYNQNENIKINVNGNRFFSHHLAILGSTGSGKSGTVAKILQNVLKAKETDIVIKDGFINNSHIIVFDVHGEYSHAFPKARVLTVDSNLDSNSVDLWLPYWLLNSSELETLFIETGERNAYNQIAQFKLAVIENKRKWNPSIESIDYDMPLYFSIREVLQYIKNKNTESHYINAKTQKICYADSENENIEFIENNFSYLFEKHNFYPTTGAAKNPKLQAKIDSRNNGFYGEFPRFITRLETKLNDSRLNFLFREPNKPEEYEENPAKTYLDLVPLFFGHMTNDGRASQDNITLIDLSALPFEVVSIIVSVISRIAFEISYYQTKIKGANRTPLLLVYEEAHRYIPKTESSKYRDTRESVERIAKEGRKYGISEMIVTQRPSEVSTTVLSQCNNFVIMKLTNQDDQNIVKSILPDSANYFTNSLSSLNVQEALLVGNAVANTVIVKVDDANPLPQSENVKVYTEWSKEWESMVFEQISEKLLHLPSQIVKD